MKKLSNMDVELGNNESYGEVVSPMAPLAADSPKDFQKDTRKVMMMSTTDRESLSGRKSNSIRPTIAIKKTPWEKLAKRFCSFCMAIFLFCGGISLFISGCVLLSVSSDSHATGMIIVGAIMIVPGIYGMHKLFRWAKKHRDLKRRHGHRISEQLIEEAEEELD